MDPAPSKVTAGVVEEEEEQTEDLTLDRRSDNTQKPLKALLVGAGRRANVYSDFAKQNPNKLKITAVADPIQYRRERMALLHLIPFDRLYISWVCVPEEKIADLVIICTIENLRLEVVSAFANRGYAIILEKPMAQTYSECKKIVQTCRDNQCILAVAHVLRYDPHVVKMLEMIERGVIGEVISVQHTNPIGWYHFAHHHVRGNWSRVQKSSTLLVNKCCHDMDFIRCLQPGVDIKTVYSNGSLTHFKEENKPSGAGVTCIGCSAELTCPYAATRIYLDRLKEGYTDWPVNEVTEFPDTDTVTEALLHGPYGRCVYEQLNDVCDNQEVMMQFENGVTATLTCNAFTEKVNIRKTVIRGSMGELTCNFDDSFIRVYDFTRTTEMLYHLNDETQVSSQSFVTNRDADKAFINAVVKAVKNKDQSALLSNYMENLLTYLLLFSAEKSRLTNRIIIPSQEEGFLE